MVEGDVDSRVGTPDRGAMVRDLRNVDRKILLVRMDRLGDLILTLPVDRLAQDAGWTSTWCISTGLEPVLNASVPKRASISWDRNFSLSQAVKFIRWLREQRFDKVVVFHAPPWVVACLWWVRVPDRIGPRSQWWSFLLFNRGLRQRRSRSELHETSYNLELMEFALSTRVESLNVESLKLEPLKLHAPNLDDFKFQSSEELASLARHGQGYVVIHPGMGGSARNWPITKYVDLIQRLLADYNFQVCITGSQVDRTWLAPIKEELLSRKLLCDRLFWLNEKLSLSEMLVLLQNARAVLAPSTGILHVAASLGVRTVGIYSPVRVQAPTRWGPRGSKATALVAQVSCPGHHHCLMKKCSLYDCMDLISVDEVIRQMTSEEVNRL